MQTICNMRKSKYSEKIEEVLKKGVLLTAQQIHEELNDIDLATVYRNLQKLVKDGHIRELSIKKGESIYEYVKDEHQHALCNVCGKVYHVEVDQKKLLSALNLKNFVLEGIEINIKGHCKKSDELSISKKLK
jgi:Fe2+ or Zn2+ uptake regulation protein